MRRDKKTQTYATNGKNERKNTVCMSGSVLVPCKIIPKEINEKVSTETDYHN